MIFIVFIAYAAIAFWDHFHPWITKNMDLETVSHHATPNHRKSQNCVQSGSQEVPPRASAVVLPQTRGGAVQLPHEGAVRGGAQLQRRGTR